MIDILKTSKTTASLHYDGEEIGTATVTGDSWRATWTVRIGESVRTGALTRDRTDAASAMDSAWDKVRTVATAHVEQFEINQFKADERAALKRARKAQKRARKAQRGKR